MNESRKKVSKILFVFIAALIAFIFSNWILEGTIKHPYLNDINSKTQIFRSPSNIIFLVSGTMLLVSYMIKIYQKCHQTNKDFADQISQNQESEIEIETNDMEIQDEKGPIELAGQKQQQNIQTNHKTQNQQSLIFQLKLHITISLPKFIQILCFLYGVKYLDFPTMLVTKILTMLVIYQFYDFKFLFTKIQTYLKMLVIISTLICSFSFYFNQTQFITEKSQQQIISGYFFIIGTLCAGFIRKVLSSYQNELNQNISVVDQVIYQSKFNLISAYLLAFYLKEQILGFVFAFIHSEFTKHILAISILLFVGTLLKKFLTIQSGKQISQFMIALQKIISLYISLLYSTRGVQSATILILCLFACSAFSNFVLELISTRKNNKTATDYPQ